MFLLIWAAGCGKDGTDSGKQETEGRTVQEIEQVNETTDAPDKITHITLYPIDAGAESGVRDGYIKELFAQNGLEVEIWAYSEDKTNAIMASGDLPDIMYVTEENLKILIEGNMILGLEDYLEKMPHVTSLEGMGTALNYMRKFQSNNTGTLYALPVYVGKGSNDGTTERYNLKVFWDYYEEIGAPEFDSLDGLIPILKEIQEKHPTDAAGNKVYAVGTYYDPANFNYLYGYSTLFGYRNNYFNQMVAADMTEGKLEYLLDEDGILKEALTWFNELYKEGLFDPNSINMDRPTHQAMISGHGSNGTYILSLPDSPGWAPVYQGLYWEGEKVFFPNYSAFGEKSRGFIVVNANTQNLDACLAMLDLMADPDQYLVWRSMPAGEKWDVKDGVAYLTDAQLECLKNGATFVASTGEEERLFNIPSICSVGADTTYKDKDGNVLPPLCHMWPEALAVVNASTQGLSWQETTGYANWVELLQDKGGLYTESLLLNAESFVEQPSDEQKLIIDSLVDTVNTAAWKMIYADTESDFETYWTQMVSDAEALGAREIYDWAAKNIENAVAVKDSLTEG